MADEKPFEETKWWIDRRPVKDRDKSAEPVKGIVEKWAFELLKNELRARGSHVLLVRESSRFMRMVEFADVLAGIKQDFCTLVLLAERVKVSIKGLRRMDVRRGPMHNDRDLYGPAVRRS